MVERVRVAVGPAEVVKEARQAGVERVAPAMDDPGAGEDRVDQAEMQEVLGHLVRHPRGGRRCSAHLLNAERFERAQARSVERAHAVGVRGRPGRCASIGGRLTAS